MGPEDYQELQNNDNLDDKETPSIHMERGRENEGKNTEVFSSAVKRFDRQ